MIFVTVGNATQGFVRLLESLDALAVSGLMKNEQVFMQTGNNSDFKALHSECKQFLSMDEFQQWMEKADCIISHGGCGTLLHAIRLGKIPIVMPRRKKYGEHVNDHQMQLVHALASEGRIIPAYEPEDLPGAIREARRRAKEQVKDKGGLERDSGLGFTGENRMVEMVGKAIEELMKRD